MKNNFLDTIIAHKKKMNDGKQAFYRNIKEQIAPHQYNRYSLFKKVISETTRINLIAEIKKASPSKGMIAEEFDLLQIASIYQNNKAAAVSILTEDKYFLGKPEYIKKVHDHCQMPILAKDFFIDEGQVFEARLNGASAILLIAAILDDAQITHLMNLAHALDLDCLLEVHDEEELNRAINLGAEIIGINNRNLHTFEVDLKTCEKLIPLIPSDKVIVAESGIQTNNDVALLKQLGAHAILVGETFMRADDMVGKINELMGY